MVGMEAEAEIGDSVEVNFEVDNEFTHPTPEALEKVWLVRGIVDDVCVSAGLTTM